MRLHRSGDVAVLLSPGLVQGFPPPQNVFVTPRSSEEVDPPVSSLEPGGLLKTLCPSILTGPSLLVHWPCPMPWLSPAFQVATRRPRLLYFAASASILTDPPVTSLRVSPRSVLAHSAIATHLTLHFHLVGNYGEGWLGTTHYCVLCLTIDKRRHVYSPQDNVQICFTGFPNDNHGISFFLPSNNDNSLALLFFLTVLSKCDIQFRELNVSKKSIRAPRSREKPLRLFLGCRKNEVNSPDYFHYFLFSLSERCLALSAFLMFMQPNPFARCPHPSCV